MITAIDTNVLLDILVPDPQYFDAAVEAIEGKYILDIPTRNPLELKYGKRIQDTQRGNHPLRGFRELQDSHDEVALG